MIELLGWRAMRGDGHFHNEVMLDRLQELCNFTPGEFIVVRVESKAVVRERAGAAVALAALRHIGRDRAARHPRPAREQRAAERVDVVHA